MVAQWREGRSGPVSELDPLTKTKERRSVHINKDLVANAVIFQNTVDITRILQELAREGFPLTRELVGTPSPYITKSIKRFGDYTIDLSRVPQPLGSDLDFVL